MGSPQKEARAWAQTALQFGLFALRHRPWRRKLMFYLSLGAMLQIAAGLMMESFLQKSLIMLSVYWGFNAMGVLLMLLLAVYDMLTIQREQREALKELRDRLFAEEHETLSDADDSGDSGKS